MEVWRRWEKKEERSEVGDESKKERRGEERKKERGGERKQEGARRGRKGQETGSPR